MTKTKKINALYKIAHGQPVSLTPEEQKELRKYKIDSGDRNYATRKNIIQYVNVVDNKRYPFAFYDWCHNNLKADRRRKGSSEREMAANNRENSIAAMMMGWLLWGLAIYWIFDGTFPAGNCAIAGAIVSAILQRLNRGLAGFTLFLLPIILMAVFGS